MLPQRRKSARSGIARAPKRDWPRHERWVRGHECCAANANCAGTIEFCHVRLGGKAGTGIKPPSWQGISLCGFHHQLQHQVGHKAFDKVHGIDSLALAAEFARRSPDTAMREAMKEQQS